MPDDLSRTPFRELWEAKIFRLLLDEGRITREVVEQMRSWQHSGFSVDNSVALDAGDTAGLECVAAYMVRRPFSLNRMVSVSDDGKVVYRAEKVECQPRFPYLATGSCCVVCRATLRCLTRWSSWPRSPSRRP